ENIPVNELVDLAKLRWRIERDYQDLKQELGLGHYEGRGWRGFHHHATLCIRLPDLREGDDSPLRTMCHPETPAACRSRRLPIQRRRRSGPNDTSQTRSPPCDDVSPSPSRGASFDVHAATRPAEPMKDAYDAVRLGGRRRPASLRRRISPYVLLDRAEDRSAGG